MQRRNWKRVAVICVVGCRALAQGTFQNLDFESASLTPGSIGSVPIATALPGWNGYVGTTPVSSVWQNDFSLGAASIDIVGPAPAWGVIEGSYSVDLQAGGVPFSPEPSFDLANRLGASGCELLGIQGRGLWPTHCKSGWRQLDSGPIGFWPSSLGFRI